MHLNVQEIVNKYSLIPHPEGGYYRETYRSGHSVAHPELPRDASGIRSASTAIYFLMPEGDFSAFHRVVNTDEIWHLYAGGPLELHLIHENGRYEKKLLTSDLTQGEPTLLVKAGCWQAACVAPGVSWAFGGCTVAPGFEFADFEMPSQGDLLKLFPDHSETIKSFSREHKPCGS